MLGDGLQKVAIGFRYPLLQVYFWTPAQRAQLLAAHEFAWRPVRLCGVEHNFTVEADDASDEESKILDRDIGSRTDIDVLVAGVGFHDVDESVGAVIGVQEFAHGRSGAPDGEGCCAGHFGLVRLADQCRQDVTVGQIEVISGPIEIGRHGGDEVAPVLAPIGLGELNAGDFGDRVPFVGGFERASQQLIFGDRLRGEFGIDAGGTEEQHLFDAGIESCARDVGRDHEVVVQEVGGIGGVGVDATHLGGGHEDRLGPRFGEEAVDLVLADEIDLGTSRGDERGAFAFEAAENRRTDHAAVTGHVDALVAQVELGHHVLFRLSR